MPTDVSLVTVTFGDRMAATRVGTGLEAIQRSAGDPLMDVIVVAVGREGRAAADQLVERTRPASLEPTVLEIAQGAGYAAAANAGVAKTSADIVVVAKPDVTFHQRFLRRIRIEAAEKWDFLAPAVREGESKPAFGAARRGPAHRMVQIPPPKQAAPVPAGNAACMIVRRPALERRVATTGGLFESEFDTGNEDLDLYWWAERNDMLVRFIPNLHVGFAVGQDRGLESEQHRRDMATYRVTVWKYAREPREWAAWTVGEASYIGEAIAARKLGALNHYLASWKSSVGMARSIKRRRGKLRA